MTTITLDEIELETIVGALRLFRSLSDLTDLPPEQRKERALIICAQVETSETGEPLITLKPEWIDELVERLRSVRG
jgi:hypothetical protein